MMSDKDNNLLKSDILTVGNELSEKLNAIGVPNTFGKASEGKDNLMSIIRMAINGIDMIIEQIREKLKDYYNKSEVNTLLNGKSDTSHNHDSAYASINHNHDDDYSDINHNHDSAYANISHNHDNAYANISHNHDNAYANISHNHDSAYASKSHQHDGADVILSNNNNVDTEIGNIEDNITLLNDSMENHNHYDAYASKNHNHDDAYASKSHQHDGTDVILSNSNDVNTEIGTIEDDITSLNGNITSINASITDINNTVNDHTTTFTDMIEKHTWNIPAFSLGSGKMVEKTVTVPNPSGYYRVPIIQGAYKCSASSLRLSGTTLTVKIQNHYSTNANATMYGVILYFKSSIITEI